MNQIQLKLAEKTTADIIININGINLNMDNCRIYNHVNGREIIIIAQEHQNPNNKVQITLRDINQSYTEFNVVTDSQEIIKPQENVG